MWPSHSIALHVCIMRTTVWWGLSLFLSVSYLSPSLFGGGQMAARACTGQLPAHHRSSYQAKSRAPPPCVCDHVARYLSSARQGTACRRRRTRTCRVTCAVGTGAATRARIVWVRCEPPIIAVRTGVHAVPMQGLEQQQHSNSHIADSLWCCCLPLNSLRKCLVGGRDITDARHVAVPCALAQAARPPWRTTAASTTLAST